MSFAQADAEYDQYSIRGRKSRLDANIGELAEAISELLAMDREADLDRLCGRLSWIACHARNTASAAGDLKSTLREEARR